MKLPNGYGSVHKLSGNRRNPWRARKTTGWSFDKKTMKYKQEYTTLGYYPTKRKLCRLRPLIMNNHMI